MTSMEKKQLIAQMTNLLERLIEVKSTEPEPKPEPSIDKPIEMLTVKECAALVEGLSEHIVRQLVAQEKIVYVRAGAGKRGKILISKKSLLEYLGAM